MIGGWKAHQHGNDERKGRVEPRRMGLLLQRVHCCSIRPRYFVRPNGPISRALMIFVRLIQGLQLGVALSSLLVVLNYYVIWWLDRISVLCTLSNTNELISEHSYSLLGLQVVNGMSMMHLRNPWGYIALVLQNGMMSKTLVMASS